VYMYISRASFFDASEFGKKVCDDFFF